MKDLNIVLAGFGGQGILFSGKVIAYSAMINDKNLSWLPSYGPEMRGGTANCSVCISDKEIGSPIVTKPNVLIAMNLPSLDKFIDAVEPGGTVLVESSLINKKVEREDINVYYVPASEIAEKNGISGLANMVMIGKLNSVINFSDKEVLDEALQKCIPAKKAEMLEFNRKAIKLGEES